MFAKMLVRKGFGPDRGPAAMRILHVTPSVAREFGGPTHSLLGFMRAADRVGISCAVAAPVSARAEADWFRSEAGNVELRLFTRRGSGAFGRSAELVAWLAKNGDAFDAIHVHGLINPVSTLAARLCRRRGWAFVIRPFGTLSRYTFTHRRALLKRLYMRALDAPNLRAAGGVHFTTAGERSEAEWQGIPFGRRAFVIPPPWAPNVDEADTAVSGRMDARVVLLSRLHPIKGIEALLDGWRLVLGSHPRAELVIAGLGDAAYVSTLKERAARLGLEQSVRFPGFVGGAEKTRLLSSASVFALPSHHENFGVAVLEALAAGAPVVITAEVHLAPFVRENGLGAVVERSPEQIAGGIMAILSNPMMRSRCAAAGPDLVRANFSPESTGQRLAEMYRCASVQARTQ